MILFAITKPRQKLRTIFKVLVTVLIAFLLLVMGNIFIKENFTPSILVHKTNEEYPGEPLRVNGQNWDRQTGYWDDIAAMLKGGN